MSEGLATGASMAGQGRLVAVMFLDMVGYSALTVKDEARAMEYVRELESIVRQAVPAAGGRLVKFMGDGSMAEFPTARAAVGAALSIQLAVAAQSDDQHPHGRFRVRIGIHLGDVIEKDADLFGEAVNLAARIQPVADPGGIALTRTVYDSIRNQIPLRGTMLHGVRLKNIPKRTPVFLVAPPTAPFAGWYLRRQRGAILLGAALLAIAAAAWLTADRWMRKDRWIDLQPMLETSYAGGGASVTLAGFSAERGTGIVATYHGGGRPEAFCGFLVGDGRVVEGGDWSRYAGVRVWIQDNDERPLQLILVEQGVRNPSDDGENWAVRLLPTSNGGDVHLPFASFERRDWQPGDQDGNGTLDMNRVLKLTAQLDGTTTQTGALRVKNLRMFFADPGASPRLPDRPFGPASVATGAPTVYSIVVTHPGKIRTRCTFDWGDGSRTDTEFESAGRTLRATHAWSTPGRFTVRARAMDMAGNSSGWTDQLPVEVTAGDVFVDDGEATDNWQSFAVKNAKIQLETTAGARGRRLSIQVQQPGVWGVMKSLQAAGPAALAACRAVRLSVRGTPGMAVRVALVEQGKNGADDLGEFWGAPVRLGLDWREHVLEFSSFTPFTDWQPPGADRDRRFQPEKLREIRLTPVGNGSIGEMSVDEVWLIRNPAPSATPAR